MDFLARLCGRAPALPPAARAIAAADRRGAGSYPDPGPDRLVAECLAWLERAQDASSSADGGVARHYSAISGWAPSYPETTGYIVPTLLAYAERTGRQDLVDRARRMLDWLVAIQFPEGAFQGGVIGAAPRLPVVFNTGQILLGLAAGARNLGGYRDALHRAADWLVAVQDPDGCWRRHASPFALAGEKTYDTHVAWGLIEAERILSGRGYGEAALANIRWALTRQQANGWFADCCLTDPRRPLTHTLGYALRGVVEGYRFSGEARLLAAARRTADGLIVGASARWVATGPARRPMARGGGLGLFDRIEPSCALLAAALSNHRCGALSRCRATRQWMGATHGAARRTRRTTRRRQRILPV